MQPQHPQPLALEHIVATYRKQLEAAIARLPSGPEREGLRGEIRQLDAARTRGRMSGMSGGVMPKLDPELLPVRPRCPSCEMRMTGIAASKTSEGFECRAFACARCGILKPG
jgi:hypothetical protein